MPAFYRNFHYKAPRFQLENHREHILHIRLRPQQLTLAIISSAGRVEYLSQLDTTAILAYGPLLQLAVQEEPLLSQPFMETRITLPAISFTPAPIFTTATTGIDSLHAAAGGGNNNLPGTRTITQTLVDLGIHFAMDFVQEDIDTLVSLFPAAVIRCEEMTSAMLGHRLSSQHPNLILAGISGNQVCIAAFGNQNLLFLNRFTWESAQDIMYFLQLAHHASGTEQTPDIVLFGDVADTSDPVKTLLKLLPSAQLLKQEVSGLFDDPEQKVPYQRYAELAF